MSALIRDGRVTGITVALKHLLERLEEKNVLDLSERELFLEGVYRELDLIPALKGEPLLDARRQVAYLWAI